MTIKKSLFLKVFDKKSNLERPPVWFMRQAGRALLSYRSLKEKYDFKELLNTPKLAADVTLLPRDALGVDALILFSDILVVPEALGVEVNYEQGGPQILKPLKISKGEFLEKENLEVLKNAYQTISEVKKQEKNIPLIGFCGGPLTVFLYLYQGSGRRNNFEEALEFFYNEPQKTDKILEIVTSMSIRYAEGQIDQGVDTFQIFETWANIIPASVYKERILPYVLEMAKKINISVPLIYFPRFFSNGYEILSPYLDFFGGIGIDYLTDLDVISNHLPKETVLQGNLDPTFVKYAYPDKIQAYLKSYLNFFKKHKRWILNLGHGVLPGTPESNLKLIVNTVKFWNG